MFDESEILFLDTAVNLQFITRSQRARLIAFAEDDDLGDVTEVVVDANLMAEEEVAETMEAIQAGVGVGPAPASLGSDDIAGAATAASIAALIGDADEVASADTDKLDKSGSGSPFDALEAASRQSGEIDTGEYDEEDEERDGPAFPLPTGANNHSEAAEYHESDAEDYSEYEEEEDGEDQTIAKQLSVSRREMASLLESLDD